MKRLTWLLAIPMLLLFNGCTKENDILKDQYPSVSKMNIEAVTANTLDDIALSEDEVNYLSPDDKELGIYTVPIKYYYYAQVGRASNRYIVSWSVSPITADPMVISYEDQYGRTVTRSLTLFDHYYVGTLTSYTSISITWSCTVFARYTYSDGTPEKTRMWDVSKTKAFN
jgi:hypothetical protein